MTKLEQQQPRRRWWIRILKWTGLVVAAALIGLGATTVALWTYHLVRPGPPPLVSQLEGIIRAKSEAGAELVFSTNLDFRGTGAPSRVLVFRAITPNPPQGDELRIYDVAHGRFRLAFAFEPFRGSDGGRPRKGIPIAVDVLAAGDLDHDGTGEAIASFTELYADGVNEHPVAIRWNRATGRFVVVPLLASRGQLLEHGGFLPAPLLIARAESYAADYQMKYLNPVRLSDRNSRHSVSTIGGETFVVVPDRKPTLVGVFVVGTGSCYQCVSRIQLKAWTIDFASSGTATLAPCFSMPRRPIVVRVPVNTDFSGTAERRWRSLAAGLCN